MKKSFVRVLSVFLAVLLLLPVGVVASAAEEYTSTAVNWWDALLHQIAGTFGGSSFSGIADGVAGTISTLSGGALCPNSEDGLHHGHNIVDNSFAHDEHGYYVSAVCDECGHAFNYYSSDLAGQAAEASHGAGRQADKVNSAGHLLWQPTWDDLRSFQFNTNSGYVTVDFSSLPFVVGNRFQISSVSQSSPSSGDFHFLPLDGSSTIFNLVQFVCAFNVPSPGSFRLLSSVACDSSYVNEYGSRSGSSSYTEASGFSHYGNWVAPGSVTVSGGSSSYRTSAVIYFPIYEFIPDEAITVTGSGAYAPSTRPGSVVTSYGDVNSHNYTDSSTSIVNESSSSYYNPVTNTTSTIQDWTYDYSQRSYNITTDQGDTVTVTYGDQNVTIKEGDTIYNIYYTIPTSDIQQPAQSVHEHTWEESSKTEYCTVPGQVIYTCSGCGETRTEATQVLGHTWQILREVHTHYDENGVQDQEGYILYECQRCGEQYKAESGGTPPETNVPDPGGSGSGSSLPAGSSGLSRVFQHNAATISQNYGTDGHTGTDCVPAGGSVDVVIAHSEGTVVWTQTGKSNNQGSSGNESYGNAVKIQHGNGMYTLYAHLANVNVSQGQHVSRGQPLGVMGNTGNSYGAHLHFEVRDSSDNNINSDPYLNADLPDFAGGGVAYVVPGMTSGGSGDNGQNGWDLFSSIGNMIGALISGLLSIIGSIAGAILDALTSLIELITGKLGEVVAGVLSMLSEIPAMFGGFLDFLGALFPFIPAEIMTLLIFGIAVIVFIGIIKAIRR